MNNLNKLFFIEQFLIIIFSLLSFLLLSFLFTRFSTYTYTILVYFRRAFAFLLLEHTKYCT